MKFSQTYLLYFLFFVILSFQNGFAQYKTAFELQNKNIKVVWFQAQQVSHIQVNTNSESNFHFSSSSEGTYKSDLYFDYQIQNDSLIIKSIYPKALEFGDNKMTSMQEFSVQVNLTMPKNLVLNIYSDMASVQAQGKFKHFWLNTKAGQCELNPFIGNANINTYDGDINIKTQRADVNAQTQNGRLDIDSFLVLKYQLDLKSVNGDIKVLQME